ncbi:MAG: hypothetical protein WD009_01825 [Phycisphaeraceae bacterium]
MPIHPLTDRRGGTDSAGPGPAAHGCEVDRWLRPFALDGGLHAEVLLVVRALPMAVRDDLMQDAGFALCDYEPGRERFAVPVPVPGASGCSRSVVLKRTVRDRPSAWVRWLIAHELAHAHLRNGGRWEGEDPEHAADALASAWGFPRPVPDAAVR